MLRAFGPVQMLVAAIEPSINDMAVNKNYCHLSNGHQLNYSQYRNLAIFMILFMLCAIEVIFVKIVTAINDTDYVNGVAEGAVHRGQTSDDNQLVAEQPIQWSRLVPAQTILQRITMATTQPFDHNNNYF